VPNIEGETNKPNNYDDHQRRATGVGETPRRGFAKAETSQKASLLQHEALADAADGSQATEAVRQLPG
jgi:hypothetical protein